VDYQEIETAVKRYGFNDRDPLNTWINAAIQDVVNADNWSWLENVVGIMQPIGQYEIELPAEMFFRKVIKMTDVTDNIWMPMDYWDVRRWYREVNSLDAVHKSQIFTTFTNRIVAWPTPNHIRTFDLLYRQMEPEISGDDPLEEPKIIPHDLHFAIVQRAAAIGLMAENEEERADSAQSQFEATISRGMDTDNLKQTGEPEQVEDTAGYYGG
jgi:hypothetical protein